MTRGTSDRYGGGGGGGGRARSGRNRNERSRRQRTGDSSSPSSSSCSDEEAFERRKGKRMTLEREKLRPLNMTKKDVTKAIFKDREKVGASMADVQPMDKNHFKVSFFNIVSEASNFYLHSKNPHYIHFY